MDRKPNFNKDILMGKVGEEDFEKYLSSSDKVLYYDNVTDDLFFQIVDVDFIQYTDFKPNGEKYTPEDIKDMILNHTKNKPAILYEVKTDSKSERTRNVVYEVISHDNVGCAAISRSNYFYYVFVDEKDLTKIKERWLIDTKKWRRIIRTTFGKVDENKLKPNNYDTYGDHVFNFLCNIKYLSDEKVAKRIK